MLVLVAAAKKERSGAWEALNTKYLGPTSRWTKVLAEELLPDGTLSSVADAVKDTKLPSAGDIRLPSAGAVKLPEVKLDAKKSALGLTSKVLDIAVEQRQKRKGVTPTKKSAAKAAKAKKEVDAKSGVIAGANLVLLVGVPIGTLVCLAQFASP